MINGDSMTQAIEDSCKKLVDLANISLKLGRVNRITEDKEGNPESDTTHSLMLFLCCQEIIDRFPFDLNVQLVGEFCVIHDLHEYLSGDTNTLRISLEQKEDKESKEKEAISELREDFKYSWFSTSLTMYHQQIAKEARFVRAVDKIVPKLTHILNSCSVLKKLGMTREEFTQRIIVEQSREIASYTKEFPFLLEIHMELAKRIVDMLGEGQ